MNLVIDVGNTRIKLAVFEGNEIVYKQSCERNEFSKALVIASEKYPAIQNCILSSVGIFTESQLEKLQKKYKVQIVTHQIKLPFANSYATPETLGVDRMVLVSAAAVEYPERNVLIIVAGRCITYDFLSERYEYFGGAISPGLEMRYKALHTFTANLPLLKTNKPEKLIGDSTANSMHSGVYQGVVFELDGVIESYNEKYSNLTVILTGGDAHLLRESLKNDIFANSNFLLKGLHYILELNKD